LKILLVEDDLELAGRIQRMLSEAGFSVQTVSDGRDAVYVGENFPLSAIVLDLGLPLLDGVSVLGHLVTWSSGVEPVAIYGFPRCVRLVPRCVRFL
jgi:DNA-binding response OmpR family regulator